MKRIVADLHIHTVLSPCAARTMTPCAIVQRAVAEHLALIAICDHNSVCNAGAVQEAAGCRLAVIAGMELTTAEEAHIVALFPDFKSASTAGEKVRQVLPDRRVGRGESDAQIVMDGQDRKSGVETKMLEVATTFSLVEAIALIKACGGLVVAAHMDRPSFSIMSQFGGFPKGLDLDAVEISAHAAAAGQAEVYRRFGLPVIASSDSHFPEDIGSAKTVFDMKEPGFAGLVLAFKAPRGPEVLGGQINRPA